MSTSDSLYGVNVIEATDSVRTAPSPWSERLRLATVAALLWAALYYLLDPALLARGLDRPVTVLVGAGGVVAACAVLLLLVVGAVVAEALSRHRDGASGLIAVGLALAAWSWAGGTMDDWLIRANPVVGPGSGRAYWPLVPEYVYWLMVAAGTLSAGVWWRHRGATGPAARVALLGKAGPPSDFRNEITALLINLAVAGTLMFILTGPRVGHTYRGQVYFAVAAAFALGTIVAGRVTGVRGMAWYLAGPPLLGIMGVLLAVARPGLPGAYANINIIPAWGLVRPLPIQMVSIGTVAIVLSLRAAARLSSEESRD